MKLACFILCLSCHLFAPAFSLTQEKPAPTEVSGDIEWIFDITEGQRIGQEKDQPLFIVFRCER